MIWLSTFKRHLWDTASARQVIQQANRLLAYNAMADLDLRAEQARLLLEAAEINTLASVDADTDQIRVFVEQSLTLLRLLNDRWYLAQGLTLLGMLLQRQGSLQESKQLLEEGLILWRELGDPRGTANSLEHLKRAFQVTGKFDESEALSRQAIAIFREVGDQRQLAKCLVALSGTMLHGGKFAESMELVRESIQIHQQLGLPTSPGFPTVSFAFALTHLGRYDEALHQQRQALLNQRKAMKDVEAFIDGPWPANQPLQNHFNSQQVLPDIHRSEVGYMCKDLGRTELALGMDEQSHQHLARAVILFGSIDDLNGLGQSLGCLGFLAYKQQAYGEACEYIRENLAVAKDSHFFLPSLTALCGVALLNIAADVVETAVELYTLAQQHRHVANSCWYADVVGSYIAAAATTLSPTA
ncbi:MAG: tetratricopeptide repeat protein, partial [Caldilineaceae bacterium]|nr:tetratricopeptide repeat protein [Caldilineaceae bacterium]